MSKSHLEIDWNALKELMLSSEMESALFTYAQGYRGDKKAWRSHNRVAIQIYGENEDNSLLKALFSGGDEGNDS